MWSIGISFAGKAEQMQPRHDERGAQIDCVNQSLRKYNRLEKHCGERHFIFSISLEAMK
jgi:hypothetical protein